MKENWGQMSHGHLHIERSSELLRELLDVLLLLLVEAGVLEEDHITVLHLAHGLLDIIADAVLHHLDLLAEELAKADGAGAERELVLGTILGATQVGRHLVCREAGARLVRVLPSRLQAQTHFTRVQAGIRKHRGLRRMSVSAPAADTDWHIVQITECRAQGFTHRDAGAVVHEVLDGLDRGADASVVGDRLAIKGHVQVAADQDLLALEVRLLHGAHRLLGHHGDGGGGVDAGKAGRVHGGGAEGGGGRGDARDLRVLSSHTHAVSRRHVSSYPTMLRRGTSRRRTVDRPAAQWETGCGALTPRRGIAAGAKAAAPATQARAKTAVRMVEDERHAS